MSITGGAGYSSNMSLGDIKNMKLKDNNSSGEDLIGPSRLKNYSPSNKQPVFKNVEIGDVTVNASTKQKSALQSRGLALGPMMRK